MKRFVPSFSPRSFLSRLVTGQMGAGVYLLAMNLLLLGCLFPLLSYFFLGKMAEFRDLQIKRTVTQMEASLRSRGVSLARSMAVSAGQAVAGFDYTFLNILMRQVTNRDPEILYCIAMDANRMAMAHSDPQSRGLIMNDPLARQAAAFLDQLATTGEIDAKTVRFLEGHVTVNQVQIPVLEIVAPIYSGTRLWGVVRCGYSLTHFVQEVARARQNWASQMRASRYSLLSISGVVLAAGLLIAFFFSRLFLLSTRTLSRGVKRISQGDLDSVIDVDKVFGAEFKQYARAFNDMTAKLRKSYHALEEYSRSLEKKVAERTQELKKAQNKLVRQAREAGMAEMAVGVLHNIGNAITPAKVGTSLVLRKLKESPIRTGIDPIFQQLQQELTNPGSIPEEERRRVLDIVRLLPEGIRTEYDTIIDELERIRAKHEHIESVISLQMRYARLVGTTEVVDVNNLLEDTLRILEEALRNRNIVVEKHFAPLPPVSIEQARLIQIFINIIKNAYEAMDSPQITEKRIVITTWHEKTPEDQVAVSIKDTGMGFEPHLAEQLFRFGYTTKESGSGFGLHSCANYLLANHGHITARSEGKGKGAEFIVRLSVRRSPPDQTLDP